MTRTYEGMFILDNDAVRADWAGAKAVVSNLVTKHSGEVATSRRWEERRLAYPISGKQRGTYLLTYFNAPGEAVDRLRRDLELEERVLRYLILSADEIPEGELELSQRELEADFTIPPPPEDEPRMPEPEPEARTEVRRTDEPAKDEPAKEAPAKEAPAKEPSAKEPSAKEAPADGAEEKSADEAKEKPADEANEKPAEEAADAEQKAQPVETASAETADATEEKVQ